MYIAICDDQVSELEALVALLESWQEARKTKLRFKTFQNATELLNAARKECFTLYLLDVMMPGVDGLEAAKEIRSFDRTADIVFLTSSPGFAYASYSVHALDYLLKPIRAEKLFPLLDKISNQEQKLLDILTLKCGSTLIRVPFSQLEYVEVIDKHLHFYLTDGTAHEVYSSLKEYEPTLLARPEFMQLHRSFIVNMFQVQELSPAGISTFSGKNIPISRRQYPQLQKDYLKLLFNEREA